ncbi:MAG: DNA polymerase III subunit beta [bacterium]|nr:MAG: DNA polymerase III subunit beta [bacterium]
MDIAVKKELFRKVVSCTTRATSNKAIQPILNNLLLAWSNGSLYVSATDLDLAIECKLPVDVSKPGKITLPAKKLDEIVNKVTGEEVSISTDKNNHANILSDRSKYKVNCASPDDFPEVISTKDSKDVYKIKQNELLQAILLTSFATSKFETTSILSGANFEIKGNKFEIGATDGSRLARYAGSLESTSSDAKEKQSIVIPGRALAELEKLITSFKEENEVISFYILPGQIVFKGNNFSLSTRLVSGTFPSYDKLIPKSQSSTAVFSRSELLNALERVAVLANERTNVIKLSFTKGGKIVHLSANSPDYGNATDEVDVNYKGNDMEIAFNYRYLSEALRNLQVENILLELETSLSPILLKISDEVDYNYTYLIMPVQLR